MKDIRYKFWIVIQLLCIAFGLLMIPFVLNSPTESIGKTFCFTCGPYLRENVFEQHGECECICHPWNKKGHVE